MPLIGFSFEPRKKTDLLLPIAVALLPLAVLVINPSKGALTYHSPILYSFKAILVATLSLAIFLITFESYRISGSKKLFWFSLAFFVYGLTALIRGFANESLVSVDNIDVASYVIFSILFILAIRTRGIDETQKVRRQKGTLLLVLAFVIVGLSIAADTFSGVAFQQGLTLPLAIVSAAISVPLLTISAFYFLRGFYRQPASKVMLAFGIAPLLMIDRVAGFFFPEETPEWWAFGFLFIVFLVMMVESFTTLSPAEQIVRFKPLLAAVFGIEALVASSMIIVSWVLGAGGFLTLYGSTIPVAPFTSISALLHALSSMFYLRAKRIRYARLFSLISLTIGALGLAGVFMHFDPFGPINSLFFSSGTVTARPLAINTALGFILSAIAILLYTYTNKTTIRNIATILASLSTCIGVLTLIGYASSVEPLYRWTPISVPMAPVTALLVSLTALSILFSSYASHRPTRAKQAQQVYVGNVHTSDKMSDYAMANDRP